MSLTLRKPEIALADSYFTFIEEMRANGEKIWDSVTMKAGERPEEFVARLLRGEASPEPGLVPESTYWAVIGGEVVGRIAFRHHLNENLQEFGGHIGYEVRPSRRGRGVAKEMLRLLLQIEEVRAAGRVLLTCAPNNTASNRTILANGGMLTATKFVEKWQRDTNYYWIALPEK